MATVYQFEYFDSLLKRRRRSDRFATEDAIRKLGGKYVPETAYDIDDEFVDDSGTVRPTDMSHATRH
jgi:hypothetical protein